MKNIHTVSCSASIFSLGIWGQETHPFQKWPEKKLSQHLKIMKMKMTLSLNEYGLTLSTLQITQLKKKYWLQELFLFLVKRGRRMMTVWGWNCPKQHVKITMCVKTLWYRCWFTCTCSTVERLCFVSDLADTKKRTDVGLLEFCYVTKTERSKHYHH